MPLDPLPQRPEPLKPVLTGNVEKLVRLTVALTELIERETALLKSRRPREAQKLHGEKSRLMAEYRNSLGLVQVNSHLLGPEDSPERKYLRDVTDELREALRDHARIVLRLKSVAEGLIKSVGEEVTRQNQPVMAYGKNAAMQRSSTARPTSLSLNQVI
ncbi:hypothetical protein [Kordiimonas marina]|uniref:hypothetical protein n=1 Tax=Kordiimonas marina TaxID=2872312 RepID=UPI001FF3AA03|nr:hypothetical protein [Kordiimonas marina]MCJ9430332.1 hypothetical protein [Kordiimonas marina]